MSQTRYAKKTKKEATETFFLYVFFHTIFTFIVNIFNDN